MTTRYVFCQKLQREAEGLNYLPYPGELGQRVYEAISQSAWQSWLNHQTMLINEYRLNPLDPKTKVFLQEQMANYLFGNTANTPPPGYVPPDPSSKDT